jgi:aromatic ring-opening dioxygenase catalytic subunit (LigB family)
LTAAADRTLKSMSEPGRMPVAYVPHGGGPFSFVDFGAHKADVDAMVTHWRAVAAAPNERPKALLVVSAHWEERVPTVMSAPQPPMLYDYYGFPPASYEIQWPAAGDPELAQRVRSLLEEAGISTAEDNTRGFDHGTFIPFKRSFPNAEIPTIQLSLRSDLDASAHIAMGRALRPLRDEGVYILGSGLSYHNMNGFRSGAPGAADFDTWLQKTVTLDEQLRNAALAAWTNAPSARIAHPREEHLLPLMICAGAAGADVGQITFDGSVFGAKVSGVAFG